MSLDEMDQLTLECLVNKHQYQKYLAKSNPELFQQQNEFSWKVKRFHEQILQCMIECLDNYSPSTVQRSQLQNAFQIFLKEVVIDIETKKGYLENPKDSFEEEPQLISLPQPSPQFISPIPVPIEYWKKQSVIKKC
jgi:hypothetical protein